MPEPAPKEKKDKVHVRKTTWPNLVEKFRKSVNGEEITFNERELASEDYRLLSLYYKQNKKVPSTKKTVEEGVRDLDADQESLYRKDILACFHLQERLTITEACERMQVVFSKFGLNFSAKRCAMDEMGITYSHEKEGPFNYIRITEIPS